MADFEKVVRFYNLVTQNKRISIVRLAKEMECSQRVIYRMVSEASRHIPIRLDNGIVINISIK
jgi:predicted DNA-binding transcriptional regulator YafY